MVKKKVSKTFLVGRDAKNGQFIPIAVARRRKATATVNRIPRPGYGDTK